jgi:predicted SprT family Zn-dependent metalloprotease|nr:MAG TPA: SprT-like family [Caudoviricetes sp.]
MRNKTAASNPFSHTVQALSQYPKSRETAVLSLVQRYTTEAHRTLQKKMGHRIILPKVRLNGRLAVTMGQARYDGKQFWVEISSKMFVEDSEVLRNVVYHEMAHVADYSLFGEWGHGESWQCLMKLLGLPPDQYAKEEEYDAIGWDVVQKKRMK